MDFAWTDEQLQLRRAAVEFASARLTEGVRERDRDSTFSPELWKACADFGLQGLLTDAPGRTGRNLLSAVATLEGIGYGARDNGLVFSVVAHAVSCVEPLVSFGSDIQRREWLPSLADGTAIGATAMTEPDSGSNALALSTTASPDDSGWVLNGSKAFVTNAPIANVFLVYARTGQGFGGLSCFLVPRGTAGLTIGPPIEKMGLRTSPFAPVYFNDCRVSSSSLVGGAGSGAMIFSRTMDVERVLVMAPALGVMQRLLEQCVSRVRDRKPGGIAIGKHQAIAHRVADMELRLDAARLLLYRAAWQHGQSAGTVRESALAKLAVSEAHVDVCRSAMQIFGGYGYTTESEIERELRDALAGTIYLGTNEIQRNLVAGLRGLG